MFKIGRKNKKKEKEISFKIRFFPQKWVETVVERALVRYKLALAYILSRVLNSSYSSGFARHVPFYCHLYATVLLMSTACRRTLCDRNSIFVIFQEMTRLLFLVYAPYCHVNSGNDVLEFAMSSIVVVFGVWILFDLRRP